MKRWRFGRGEDFAVGVICAVGVALACCGVALVCCDAAWAQSEGWKPSAGHTEVAIWPGAPPDAAPVKGPEVAKAVTKPADVVVGRVSVPTITVYSPAGKNTGAAVVVFPGGGYWSLSMDLEGTEACDWLTSRGITCVLLKYRVPGNGRKPRSGPYPLSPMALEDAQRTVGLVRMHAAEWKIDPHKVGVMGFSAGGHLVAAISTHFAKRVYAAVDAADQESCRPDFAVALYPGHLTVAAAKWDADEAADIKHGKERDAANDSGEWELNPEVPVSGKTPPTFLVQAENDPVDDIANSLVYFVALKKAGVPAEMHVYAKGGHGFGLRQTKLPVSGWPKLLEVWLGTIGVME
jgi:acetyl esterase/lipase